MVQEAPGPERRPAASRGREGERGPTDAAGDRDDGGDADRVGRFALGAETGVRRFVRLAAVLLWLPFGFVFWIPFLLRRTVSYVFVVLYAGLVGGETDRAEERWEQAVAFYQLGFQRIVHAFRSGEAPDDAPERREPRPTHGPRRFLLESAWTVVVWGLILWLVGLWPDAPGAIRSALLRCWELIAGAGRQFDAWAQELLAR